MGIMSTGTVHIGKNVLNTSCFGLVFIKQIGLFTVSDVCIDVMLHVKLFVNKLLQTAAVS